MFIGSKSKLINVREVTTMITKRRKSSKLV
jgi:hypothetical protein